MSVEQDIANAIKRGIDNATSQGVAIAIKNMSGPYSQAMLTAMGHPYAVRHRGKVTGVALLPKIPVNVQTGKVRADWKTTPAEAQGDEIVGTLKNENPIIDYLQDGTNKMIPRPIREAIEEELQPQLEGFINRELSRIQGEL